MVDRVLALLGGVAGLDLVAGQEFLSHGGSLAKPRGPGQSLARPWTFLVAGACLEGSESPWAALVVATNI
jgi:hypothetical protein